MNCTFASISEKEKELNLKLDFEVVDVFNQDFNQDGKNDIIRIEKISGWEDPGDFHKITIKLSGQQEKIFFNIDGWVEISDYEMQYVNHGSIKPFEPFKYFLIQKASKDNVILLAFGYAYASQPGLLSIINLTKKNSPTLVFNDNYYLYGFEDLNSDKIDDIAVTKFDKDENIDNHSEGFILQPDGYYKKQ